MALPFANPQQHYLKTQIETASQPQLLLMIFDAAVKKLHFAKKAVLNKEIEKAHIELTKVQRIFTELMVALDLEKGGELAQNLLRIYDFVYHHLVKANIKQDAAMIEEVLPIVEDLRSGWTQAVEKFLQEEGGQSSDAAISPIANPAANFQRSMPAPSAGGTPTAVPLASIAKATIAKPVAYPKPIPPASSAQNASEEPPAARPRLNLRG